ncbi:DUF4153 domain-containing protein [Prolixibacter bellariivorans]|uniref:DUF4153 domain-containing protein n=1 Tax=Prolixibacter bellariivorans TaxID=314319 RepID=A0A5M4B0L2_9BACT|nr:hypothetical protein [Prolixibacter bellariivorans]GET33709.1 DUF4153 domain-containing protein [Prolixibacter bellariivorans]
MKTSIYNNLNNPEKLEELYQTEPKRFEQAFRELYPYIAEKPGTKFWMVRLDFKKTETPAEREQNRKSIWLLILCSVFAIFLIKLPDIAGRKTEDYYSANAAFIVFAAMTIYIFFDRKIWSKSRFGQVAALLIVPVIYINLFPGNFSTDIRNLTYIHFPVLLWGIFGWVYINFYRRDYSRRADFIRANGDIIILTGLILIAGGIMTGLTMGLFNVIHLDIEKFYLQNIVPAGLVSAPLVSLWVIRHYPNITNRLAPIIARIFTPLVFLSLLAYLIAIPWAGTNLFSDREFLLLFNLMLLAVAAIIAFSLSETKQQPSRFNLFMLFGLTIMAGLANLLALAAITYRIGEFGITPNRFSVIAINLLLFVHLIFIGRRLGQVIFQDRETRIVEKAITAYIPVYLIWAAIVIFFFPIIFCSY